MDAIYGIIKKISLFIVTSVIMISLLKISIDVKYDTVSNTEYDTEDYFIDKNNVKIIPVETDGIINGEQDENLNYAYNYWNLIPENIREEIVNNGWHIELTDEHVEDEVNIDYDIVALTLPKDKLIKIEDTQCNIRDSLIHEIGHALDCIRFNASDSDEFIKIYNSEKENISIDRERFKDKLNNKEYFAEAFRKFIMDNENLEKEVPLTYNYMKYIINK